MKSLTRAGPDQSSLPRGKAAKSTELGVMMEYTFALKCQLSEQDRNQDELVERLGEAGCDDSLVGIGQPGCIALEFAREAVSAEAALVSALEDVKGVIPSATLIEAVYRGYPNFPD